MSVYGFSVMNAGGNEVSLGEYRGKALLIVNTATACGFTPQYAGLQKLYNTYRVKGFEILDFPCNQFAGQAPGSDSEIETFCISHYGTTFPRFRKIDVNGKNADPLYIYLKSQKTGTLGSSIKWNFSKFLTDRTGKVVGRYAPNVTPEDLEADIKAVLE